MSCSIFPFTFRYKKTVPQLLIRWSVQKHYITIPKSTQKDRIIENVDVFDFVITEEDMFFLTRRNSIHPEFFFAILKF